MTLSVRSHRLTIRSGLILFSVLFLISGCAGLIYEVVWEKLLELYFGVTMISVTLIVAAYMLGLGIGSLLGGRISRQINSLLPVYAGIEIGIGLFGFASLYLIRGIGEATAGSPYPLEFVLCFLILLWPTALMGMTLPLLAQVFIRQIDTSGRVVGLLYGLNTLGAATGSALTGYILIAFNGLDGARLYAVALNVGIGLSALLISRYEFSPGTGNNTAPRSTSTEQWKYPNILAASFLTGFLGLGYEMLWIRILSVVNKATVYNFPTVLAVYLFGLAVGGTLWGRAADRTSWPTVLFCVLELGGAVLAILSFLLVWWALSKGGVASWLRLNFRVYQKPISLFATENGLSVSPNAFGSDLIIYLLPVLLLVLPASLLTGGGLPVLDKIAIESSSIAGRRVGDIHLANILGSVAGTLAISFFFLPVLSSEVTIRILAGSSLLFPLLGLLDAYRPIRVSWSFWPLPGLAALNLLFVAVAPGAGAFYTRLYEVGTGMASVVRETPETVLALTLDSNNPANGILWIGGEINSLFPSDGSWEFQSYVCASASRPHRILIIGYGGGHTAAYFQQLPGVQEVDVVELIPNLVPFLQGRIPSIDPVISDPRVHLISDDGRRYLYAHPEERFDLISIDPVRSYTSGNNDLYSMEAMALYRQHLTASGILCAWVDEDHILSKTLATSFSFVDEYQQFDLASSSPIRYDYSTKTGYSEPVAVGKPRIMNPDRASMKYIRNQDQIRLDEASSPVLTDSQPLLEYYLLHPPINKVIKTSLSSHKDYYTRIFTCKKAWCNPFVH